MTEHRTDLPSFSQFEAGKRALGFDEIVERRWPSGDVQPQHGHPFAVDALVVEGEMWLTQRGETRHLRPGDTFQLDRDEPHAERYGEAGATYWAARRS